MYTAYYCFCIEMLQFHAEAQTTSVYILFVFSSVFVVLVSAQLIHARSPRYYSTTKMKDSLPDLQVGNITQSNILATVRLVAQFCVAVHKGMFHPAANSGSSLKSIYEVGTPAINSYNNYNNIIIIIINYNIFLLSKLIFLCCENGYFLF